MGLLVDKYSKEELKEMATTCLAARDSGDVRYSILIKTLSAIMGIPVKDVENRIEYMAI